MKKPLKDYKNLQLVKEKINSVFSDHKFIKQAKAERIEKYTSQRDYLENSITIETIEKHNWAIEVLHTAFHLEKLDYWHKKVAHLIKGLERHSYAPELNTLYFINGKQIKVSQCNTIEQAQSKLINSLSIEQIKEIPLK